MNPGLDNRNQDIILWSGDVSIVQGVIMAQGSSIFINEMNDNLKRYNKANPFYEEIGIAHSSGSIITTSLQKTLDSNISENKSISTKDYFKQSMKGETFITRVQPSELTSKPVFIISSPIKDMADEIIGCSLRYRRPPLFHEKICRALERSGKRVLSIFSTKKAQSFPILTIQ